MKSLGLLSPRRVYYGWWVLAVTSLASVVGGLHIYGFSIFFIPLSQEFGVNRAATSLIFALARGEGALWGPIAGWLVDRLGARIVLTVSGLIAGIGYLLLSQMNSYLGFLLVYLVVISLTFQTGFFSAPLAAINMWFIRRKALAFSLRSAMMPLGGAFLIPLLSFIVLSMGWRQGAIFSGLLILLVVVPMALVVRRSPEAMGLRPDGDPVAAANAGEEAARTASADFTVRESLRTFSYWLLVAASTTRIAVSVAVTVHLVPILVWKGLDAQNAANLMAVRLIMTVPLMLIGGWIADRARKQTVMSLGAATGVVGYLLLILGHSPFALYLAMLGMAGLEAVIPINWAIVGDFYGRKNFATLRGIVTAVSSWCSFIPPVLAGWLYDRTQSYELTLWLFSATLVVSVLLFAVLPPPKLPLRLRPSSLS